MGTYDTIFGDYIKELRKNKIKTLDKVAERLKISLSLLSDIETGRRSPFEPEKMEEFAKFLFLTEDQKAELYDRAAKYKKSVPDDVKETVMLPFPESKNPNSESLVRLALRATKSGKLSEKDWQDFVKKIKGDNT
jgi:transcriptional regulator with XRE-family HTH domain